MNYLRRPFPKNAGDIGIWKVLMEFASLLGILINSLIITYTNDNMGDFDNRFIYFLLMLILSYGIKFIMFLLYVNNLRKIFLFFPFFYFCSKDCLKTYQIAAVD